MKYSILLEHNITFQQIKKKRNKKGKTKIHYESKYCSMVIQSMELFEKCEQPDMEYFEKVNFHALTEIKRLFDLQYRIYRDIQKSERTNSRINYSHGQEYVVEDNAPSIEKSILFTTNRSLFSRSFRTTSGERTLITLRNPTYSLVSINYVQYGCEVEVNVDFCMFFNSFPFI